MHTVADIGETITSSLGPWGAPSCVVALGQGARVTCHVGGSQTDISSETLFGIASVTKTLTTVLVLQLVAEGRLDLDTPITSYLPWFELADAQATSYLTTRHLLTHTSGIDAADDFTDTGEDDGCLERYVHDVVSGSEVLHPVGERWSYCNAGFSVLGHLVEVLSGACWDDVVTDSILGPCDMGGRTRYRLARGTPVATGHRTNFDTGEVIADDHRPPRSIGPAGSTLLLSAGDLVRFAQHLMDGDLLPPELLAAMWRVEATSRSREQGLGWIIRNSDPLLVCHAGNSRTFTAFLALRPDTGQVLSVTANGEGASLVAWALSQSLFPQSTQRRPAGPAPRPEMPEEAACGVYARRGVTMNFNVEGGELVLSSQLDPLITGIEEDPSPLPLQRVGSTSFSARRPFAPLPTVWDFGDLNQEGRPRSVFASRLAVRVE